MQDKTTHSGCAPQGAARLGCRNDSESEHVSGALSCCRHAYRPQGGAHASWRPASHAGVAHAAEAFPFCQRCFEGFQAAVHAHLHLP